MLVYKNTMHYYKGVGTNINNAIYWCKICLNNRCLDVKEYLDILLDRQSHLIKLKKLYLHIFLFFSEEKKYFKGPNLSVTLLFQGNSEKICHAIDFSQNNLIEALR
jgi:hypothetical protein